MSKTSHMERTATEPRGSVLHTVVVKQIDQINDRIRVIRLEIPAGGPSIGFLPGQFLDVFCPGVPKAGGFTPTSPPSRARWPAATAAQTQNQTQQQPCIELAVQRSPENDAAAWFWRGRASSFPADDDDGDDRDSRGDDAEDGGGEQNDAEEGGGKEDVIGTELKVRVGGCFVFPPPGVPVSLPTHLTRVDFVAGGVGVNPLVCMASHLAEQRREAGRLEVRFLYSLRGPRAAAGEGEEEGLRRAAGGMLFVERLAGLFARERLKGRLDLFITGDDESEAAAAAAAKGATDEGSSGKDGNKAGNPDPDGVVYCNEVELPFRRRRMNVADVAEAVGPDKRTAVVYICGVPTMTDEFVRELTSPKGLGMERHRVLCEKWW